MLSLLLPACASMELPHSVSRMKICVIWELQHSHLRKMPFGSSNIATFADTFTSHLSVSISVRSCHFRQSSVSEELPHSHFRHSWVCLEFATPPIRRTHFVSAGLSHSNLRRTHLSVSSCPAAASQDTSVSWELPDSRHSETCVSSDLTRTHSHIKGLLGNSTWTTLSAASGLHQPAKNNCS